MSKGTATVAAIAVLVGVGVVLLPDWIPGPLTVAEVRLAEDDPDPDSTEIPVRVRFRECADGHAPGDVEEVVIAEDRRAVVMTMIVRLPSHSPLEEVVGGIVTCPSNDWLPHRWSCQTPWVPEPSKPSIRTRNRLCSSGPDPDRCSILRVG